MKTKFSSSVFLLLFLVSLATPVFSQLLVASPKAAAAGCAGAEGPSATDDVCDSKPIVVTIGSGSPQTYSCYPYMIDKASVPSTFEGYTSSFATGPQSATNVADLLELAADRASDPDQKATFKEASNPNNQLGMIGFATQNPIQNGGSTQCEAIGLLIQSVGDSHVYYGLAIPPSGPYSTYNGAVNSSQDPGTLLLANYGSNPAISFKLNNYDPDAFAPPGSVGGGSQNKTCVDGKFSNAGLNNGNGPEQTQACINKYASTAQFLDAQTISFAGAIFKAASWTGSTGSHPSNDSMRYELKTAPTSDPNWIKSSQPSYIDIDTSKSIRTSSDGIDLNITENDPTSFAADITNANSNRSKVVVGHFSNCVGDTCYDKDSSSNGLTFKIRLSAISTFARYYPDGGDGKPLIQTIFTEGGTNEATFIGNYQQIDQNHQDRLVLATNGPSGCNANSAKPYFDSLPGDIGKKPKGTLVPAPWQLNTGNDCLTFHQATISLYVMSPSDKPGEVSSIVAQCVNDDGQTAPFADIDKKTCPEGYHLQGGTAEQQQTCEQVTGAIGWFMCVIIDALADVVNSVYSDVIVPMLKVPALTSSSSASATDDKGANKIREAWSSFRVFGNIILVIVVLIIVFGEAVGGGMLDAYTIKKVLPRLLIAAIGINLSYYIVGGFIDITNVVGNGVRLMITGPFGLQNNNFSFPAVGGDTQAGFLGISGVGIGIVIAGIDGAALAGAFAWFFFTLLPMVFLLFVAIIGVLALRLGLIYAAVLLSPVAFALWVLPNTEQYFKKWWEILQNTAMVYPIISALFGISMVLAQTTVWATENTEGWLSGLTGAIGYIVSLIIVIMPLVLIPFAFKLAGGILGRAYDLASNARNQGNGWLKKRGELRKQRMLNEAFFNPNSRLGQSRAGQWMNRNLQRNAVRALNEHDEARGTRFGMPGSERRTQALNNAVGNRHEREAAEVADRINKLYGGDENKTKAAMEAYKDGKFNADIMRAKMAAMTKLDEHGNQVAAYTEEDINGAITKTQQIRGMYGDTAFRLGSALSYVNNGTVDDHAMVDAMSWIKDATHGDKQAYINMSLQAAEIAKNAGRGDLASSSPTDNIRAMEMVERINNTEYSDDDAGRAAKERDKEAISQYLLRQAKKTRSPGEIAMMKGDAIARMAPLMVEDIHDQQAIVLQSQEYQDEQWAQQAIRVAQSDVNERRQAAVVATREVEAARAAVTYGGEATAAQQDRINIALTAQATATAQLDSAEQTVQAQIKIHREARKKLETTDAHQELMKDLARAKGLEEIVGQIPEGKAAAYVDTVFSAGTVTGIKYDKDGNPDGYEYGTLTTVYNSPEVTSTERFRQHHREFSDAESLRNAATQSTLGAAAGPPTGPPTAP